MTSVGVNCCSMHLLFATRLVLSARLSSSEVMLLTVGSGTSSGLSGREQEIARSGWLQFAWNN